VVRAGCCSQCRQMPAAKQVLCIQQEWAGLALLSWGCVALGSLLTLSGLWIPGPS
jgi:hypothetical protein